MNVSKRGRWKLAAPLLAVLGLVIGAGAALGVLDGPDRKAGTGEPVHHRDGDDVAEDGFTSTQAGPNLDPADAAVLDESLSVVEAYLDASWRDPAASGDPFGYDYTVWLDVAAHPDLDRDVFAAGPVAVGLDEYNANLDRYVANRHADLRSALWVLSATPETGDWRAHLADAGFEFGSATAASYITADTFVVDGDSTEAVLDRDPDGNLIRVRWPFTAGVNVKMTVDGTEMVATYTMAATLELWPVDGDETNLRIGSIASPVAHVNGLETNYIPVDGLNVGELVDPDEIGEPGTGGVTIDGIGIGIEP